MQPAPPPRTPLASVVGLPAAEVAAGYRAEGYRVEVLAPGTVVTLEYRFDRIRLVAEDGLVLEARQG